MIRIEITPVALILIHPPRICRTVVDEISHRTTADPDLLLPDEIRGHESVTVEPAHWKVAFRVRYLLPCLIHDGRWWYRERSVIKASWMIIVAILAMVLQGHRPIPVEEMAEVTGIVEEMAMLVDEAGVDRNWVRDPDLVATVLES
jgi:hypothetical protein